MAPRSHGLRVWGMGGTLVAAVFAVWLLFLPAQVAPYFAWPAEPRLGQMFIGAGFIFRTGFFWSVMRDPAWFRVRWIFWGNLVFTGALLLATFVHAEAFNWGFPTALIWLILYVIEPVLMIYQVPHGADAWSELPVRAGPIQPTLKWLLVAEAGLLGTVGALLVFNPTFMSAIWPWSFRALGSRIIAAWFLGWATWAGTMAFARDWEEIRTATRLNILFGLALLVSFLVFLPQFDFTRPGTVWYAAFILLFTLALAVAYWRQQRAAVGVTDRLATSAQP